MRTSGVRSIATVAAGLVLATGVTTGVSTAAAPAGIPEAGPSSTEQGVLQRTFAYDKRYGDATTFDVYLPPAAVGRSGLKLPTVVLVHGGAWTRGSREAMAPQAGKLARNGFVAVSVNYRLATAARWPAQRVDVQRAVTFLRRHAAFLNIDPGRVALLGSSAGGHIAAAVAAEGSGAKRFRGVVVLSGLLNPRTVTQEDPGFEDEVVQDKLIGCDPTDCPDRYVSATPAMDLDESDVPSLLFHSREESPFGPRQSMEYVDHSRSVGVPSRLLLLDGDRHGSAYWSWISGAVIEWLRLRLR